MLLPVSKILVIADRCRLKKLDKIPGVQRGSGGVICLYDRLVTLSGSDKVIPVSYL